MIPKPIAAFLNLPWFTVDDNRNLRRGIRGGSRWPFTCQASRPPGASNFPFGEYVPSPYFLLSAAGYAQKAVPDVQIVVRDSIARYESYAEFDEWWQATAPDYVVIETGSPCWEHDKRFIQAMRRSNPAVAIAVFGPNARELASSEPAGLVDAWLLGEPDRPVVRFLKGERGVIGFDLLPRDELRSRSLAFPMFDETCANHYADSNPKSFNGSPHPWPELTVWGSRGCFAKCQFCSWPASMTNDDPAGANTRSIRFYHPEWIEHFIRERLHLSAKTGKPIQAVRFDDDLGNASNRHTLDICDRMRKIGLPWSMMCRADTSSREVWQAMRDAGCFGVKIGFESASDRITNKVIGKKLDLKKAEETCRFLRSIGMQVHTTWMVGSMTETPEERKLTLDTIRRFYVENVHSSHQLSGQATIAGTPLANTDTSTDPNFVRDADGVHRVEQILGK